MGNKAKHRENTGVSAASLDPDNWPDFRRLCHDMLEKALNHLEGAAERPAWRAVPDEVKEAIAEPLPFAPQGSNAVAEDLLRWILPFSTGNTHPRFFGWVHGAGTPGGILAEMMAAAINANLGGRDHAPIYIERQVIEWWRQIFGFPKTAGGLLVSGTSMATLIGLTIARNQRLEHDVRSDGLGPSGLALTAYTSAEAHGSVGKAMELLGLGQKALRILPCDSGQRLDTTALREAIDFDLESGLIPFCVVATAGSVNTGSIDDIEAIASICDDYGLWLHLDGAFGALAILAPEFKDRLAGIERADSLAFDFHKWMQVPYDAGCILVRDAELQRRTFSSRQAYLAAAERGAAGGNPWYCEFGPELSRGFRALKVWFTMKEHGLQRLGEVVSRNCRQARDLGEQVERHPRLELLAPVSLNIVCFRFVEPSLSGEELDRLNAEIVVDLQEKGVAVPSTTRLQGRLAIRVNLTNHRTRSSDLGILIAAIVAIGKGRLSGSSSVHGLRERLQRAFPGQELDGRPISLSDDIALQDKAAGN